MPLRIEPDPWQTARLLYECQQNRVVPPWDQLQHQGACQSVWYEKAQRKIAGVTDWWSSRHDNGKPGVAADLRQPTTRRLEAIMNKTAIIAALAACTEAFDALSAAFSLDGSDGSSEPVDGKAAKPGAKSAAKPAAKSAGKSKAAPPEAEEVDIDTVREKMKELVEAKGSDALLAAFAEVGAGKLADVDESQYQELIDAAQVLLDAEEEEAPAPKAKAKGKKAAAGPTLDEVNAAAAALIEADKPAYLKLMKKLGKPSEMDEADYAKAITAYEAAMPEEEEESLL